MKKLILIIVFTSCAISLGRFLPKEDIDKYEKKSLEQIESNNISSLSEACSTIESLELNTSKIRIALYEISFSDRRKGIKLENGDICVPRFISAETLSKIMGYRKNNKIVRIQDDKSLKLFKIWIDDKLSVNDENK